MITHEQTQSVLEHSPRANVPTPPAPPCVQNALVRRCEERQICTATSTACAVLGAAVDAGIVTLEQVLDLARSCNDAGELGDALTMLAATVRDGQSEGVLEVPTWTR